MIILILEKKAFSEALKPMIEQGMRLKINREEVFAYRDYANEIGSYKMFTPGSQKLYQGYYSTLWKKSDGKWIRLGNIGVTQKVGCYNNS